jgi:leucyl-tRNA synthetase
VAKRLVDMVKTLGDEMRRLIAAADKFDELEALNTYKTYLEKTLGVPLEIYDADDETAPDLGGKKRAALPLKPGIYIHT